MASKMGKIFLAGVLGAVAGLLFAPKSGKETREDLMELADNIRKQIKNGVKETNERVKEVFGNASETAVNKYNEIKGTVVDKVAAVKTAGKEIDKEKYTAIVDTVVEEFKSDFATTKSGAVKMANQLKKDWERIRKALA